MGLNEAEDTILQVVASTSSGLSIIGSLHILWTNWRKSGSTVESRLVTVLAWLNLFASFSFVFGRYPIGHSTTCLIQGLGIQFFSLSGIFWTACMAFNLHFYVYWRVTEDRLRRCFWWYMVVSFAVPIGSSIYLATADEFSDAQLWCWVVDPKLRFPFFYAWVVAAWLYTTIVYVLVHRAAKERLRFASASALEHLESRMTAKLTQYVLVFIAIWAAGLLNRVINLVQGVTFWSALLHVTFVPLQGFLNAIVYGSFFDRCRPRSDESQPLMDGQGAGDYQSLSDAKLYTKISMCLGTWNLGEAMPPSDLSAWLPSDKDMYVIGVQECMHLPELKKAITATVGVSYAIFSSEIGSTAKQLGYHGFVAIIICVKRGANLGFTRASNKGAIGMACRIGRTSLAFVTCHLSSDLRGRSRVEKRNTDAQEILKNLVLEYDDSGFEFPDCNHHSFILGDLNYRLDLEPREAMSMLVSRLGVSPSAEFFREYDQLASLMADGQVFYGFKEAPINFFPTYRLKRGEEGQLPQRESAMIDNLISCYTIDVKEKDGAITPRTPSYTDRIIWKSLGKLENRISNTTYEMCEGVRDSDHNPVSLTFDLQVDIAPFHLVNHQLSSGKWRDTAGKQTVTARLSQLEVDIFHGQSVVRPSSACDDGGSRPPSSASGSTLSSRTETASPVAFGEADIASVATLFPIPGEDPSVISQRINALLQSTSSDHFSRTSWAKAKRNGISLKSVVKKTATCHALLRLEGSGGEPLAQAVIDLAIVSESSVDTALTRGGQLLGMLRAKLTFTS